MVQARGHNDLDKELRQKMVLGQGSWWILKNDPTEISSGSNVDMSKREKSRLTRF